MASVENFVKGAGKIYFDDGTGERVINCSESFALTIETEKLALYCADQAVRKKVKEIPVQTDYQCSFATKDISPDNLAMLFLGTASTITTALTTGLTETITDVKRTRFYQIGTSTTNPTGLRNLTTVVVKVGAVTKALDTDYKLDATLGRIEILSAGIADGDDVIVEYGVAASTRTQVISSSNVVTGSIRYIADNTSGDNDDFFMPQVTLSPSGSFDLKGDDWQTITFDVSVEEPAGGGSAVYIDGRAV